MRILFSEADLLNSDGSFAKSRFVLTDGTRIVSVGETRPGGSFDREIRCAGKLMIPGLYNCHTHMPMTLFRGYGEDLPLQQWLFDRIFPAEDRLTPKSVYDGTLLACAEMIRYGVISASDMYFFCDQIAEAVARSGMKANLSRACQCFGPDVPKESDPRFREAVELHRNWHGACDGRIRVDMAIHAEYTAQPEMCRYVADYAKENGLGLQVHLSETESEHRECMERRGGKTPAEFLDSLGVLDARVTAAHAVWVSDSDLELLRAKDVTVAHNPASNLKLGSGVMPLLKMHRAGIRVTLGTDGPASNNRQDILREMNLAALLEKGTDRAPDAMQAKDFIPMATKNGAAAQNRPDCGTVEAGARADIVLLDLEQVHNIPMYSADAALLYSVTGSDVCLTMADGEILYENGEYRTIDIERTKAEFRHTVEHYFD